MRRNIPKYKPTLRFKDKHGKDFLDWENKRIQDICEINPKSGQLPKSFIYIDLDSVDKGILVKKNELLKNNSPSRAQRVLKKQDVLFQTVRPYQKNNYYFELPGDYVASTGYALLRAKSSSYFLYCLLHVQKTVNKVLARSTGTSYPAIKSSDLGTIKVAIPSALEQQKIANFLSSVDTKIEQLSQKKDLLERYKKGIMQQLFSREIRFKDANGKDFPEWKKLPFTNLFKAVSTKKFQIRSSEIMNDGPYKVVDQGKALVAGFSDKKEKVYLTDGVIVYGDHTTIVKFVDFNFILGADGTKVLKSLEKERSMKYLYYCLDFNNVKAEGYKRHFRIVKQLLLPVPCTNEQQKIAKFLSAIDAKIEHVALQIEHARKFKKGMLQQMFV